jgi:hypothetical protein
VEIIGQRCRVLVPVDEPQRFFRLRRISPP